MTYKLEAIGLSGTLYIRIANWPRPVDAKRWARKVRAALPPHLQQYVRLTTKRRI